jgi:hypothetical protein
VGHVGQILPFVLSGFLGVVTLASWRKGQPERWLAAAMAVLAMLIGLDRSLRLESPRFYWYLSLEAFGLGVSVYLLWRFKRASA